MDLSLDSDEDIDIRNMLRNLSGKQKLEILSFTGGGLSFFFGLLIYIHASAGLKPLAGALFVVGILIGALPYGLYTYFRDRSYRKMEDEFPAFMRNVSESIKSGMSLPEAFKQATKTDYGRLDPKIQKAAHQLSWGIPFPEVMDRMADEFEGSGLIRRALYIILQAYESGGNISETMDSIAANASNIREAEEKKKAVLMQQVYIIYAIHFLFLGIIIALYMLLGSFLLNLGSSGSGTAAIGGLGEVKNFCEVGIAQPLCGLCPAFGLGDATDKICYYKSLFLLMLAVAGIFNGLVAGEVLEGKASAGLKHAMIMAPLGLILYVIAINII